jgi:hypothetical protein
MILTKSRTVVANDVVKKERVKKGSSSKSVGTKDGDVAATETIIQELKSKPIWCTAHLNVSVQNVIHVHVHISMKRA